MGRHAHLNNGPGGRGEDKKVTRIYTMKLAIKAYEELEKYYTKLWEAKGILWD